MTHPTDPEINLTAGEFWAGDHHAKLRWMREHAPVYWDGAAEVWGITRYDDVMEIERTPEVFSNAQGIVPHSYALPMMISMDDPDHLKRRKLVNRGFTPRQVRSMEPRIRQICDGIIDRVAERGECDFVHDVAAPLPIIVIADMLGFPEEDRDTLLEWSDNFMKGTTSTDPEAMQVAADTMVQYDTWCRAVVADRRASEPTGEIMSRLVHAEVDGERLDDDSLVYESLLLLIGGDETTRHVISGGMYELLREPARLRALVDDPGRIPTAVEEMLRWVTPIKNMARTATRDVELRGQHLAEGQQLLLLYPSANRDEAVFDDPDTFDIARDPNPHVAFGGHGPHYCLGASLARLELNVMFERLVARLPDLELAGDEPPPIRPAHFVSGYEAMPVRFAPTTRQASASVSPG